MAKILQAGDIISGQEATATATINGKVVDLFMAKSVEASIEKQKSEVKTLGKRGTQYKANGFTGSGSMTLYYVTSEFRKLLMDYVKNGIDVYFTLTITNQDPSSKAGKQTVALYDCNLDSGLLAKFDVDSEFLDESFDFTFSDADLLSEFNEL